MTSQDGSVRDFLAFVVRSIVAYPDDVQIDEVENQRETIFELSVHQDDDAALQGADGAVARALTTVVDACAYKQRARVQLVILGDEDFEDDDSYDDADAEADDDDDDDADVVEEQPTA